MVHFHNKVFNNKAGSAGSSRNDKIIFLALILLFSINNKGTQVAINIINSVKMMKEKVRKKSRGQYRK